MWDKDIAQLLHQESFLNYCFKRNDADVRHWENWLKENPTYADQVENLRQMVVLLADESSIRIKDKHFAQLQKKIGQSRHPVRRVLYPFWNTFAKTAAAAIVLVTLSFVLYSYLSNYIGTNNQQSANSRIRPITNNDIEPGGNRATLTLADGRKIALDDVANGQLAEESGIRITKTEAGQIVYEIQSLKTKDQSEADPNYNLKLTTYNTIETPKGGQYKVILPDSSVVWLNAASSLRYPTRFTSEKRIVELKGEAYFQVSSQLSAVSYQSMHSANQPKADGRKLKAKTPFIVATATQEVTVLGTHFNINAYEDEPMIKTTLLEGSVRVVSTSDKSTNKLTNQSTILRPGQQSTLLGKSLAVVAADAEEAIAWKNGMFVFNDEPLESIMRKVSRWYNAEIVYDDGVDKNELYGGSFSRYDNVSSVLRKLELTGGIHFKIQAASAQSPERRIVVMR